MDRQTCRLFLLLGLLGVGDITSEFLVRLGELPIVEELLILGQTHLFLLLLIRVELMVLSTKQHIPEGEERLRKVGLDSKVLMVDIVID